MADITDPYADLITSEHNDKPNFVATVRETIRPLVELQDLLNGLILAFDLDVAIGVQEDAVGVRVGRSRFTQAPLTAYFSLDVAGLGLDEGILWVPFDPLTGLSRLPDDLYRTLLRAVIKANQWDGTFDSIYDIWGPVFDDPAGAPANRAILVQDRPEEQAIYIVLAGNQPLPLYLGLFSGGGLLKTKPTGITLVYAVPSVYPSGPVVGGTPLFGLDVQNDVIGGLDSGAFVTVVRTE